MEGNLADREVDPVQVAFLLRPAGGNAGGGSREKEEENLEQNVRENKMGIMPVNKLLLNMAVPMIVSMLVQALYNVVDSVFVAKLSEDALNAVSLAFPVQNLMISVGVGTGCSGCLPPSQAPLCHCTL